MYDDDGYDIEREQADFEQAELEVAGRNYSRRLTRMRQFRNRGQMAQAALECPHGGGYPLKSLAAKNSNDPRAGQDGFRCSDCGSVLSNSPFDGNFDILESCEDF